MAASAVRVEAAILELVSQRGPCKSICPSEAARLVGGENWHGELPLVRRVAVQLALAGKIQILRKGKPVADAADVKGVIRLRLAPSSDD